VSVFLVLMAISIFLVRIVPPENKSALNVHPGDFPQYVQRALWRIVAAAADSETDSR